MAERIEGMDIGGKHYDVPIVEPADKDDATLAEMKQVAEQNGLILRLWWEGIMGTMDYRTDRINAHIEKGNDGKWRIADKFDIG